MKQNSILMIYGPTAVGKTALVDMLAEHIPLEVINMDVGQFYAPFTIGTAKPDWRNASVPHHLFDMLIEPRNYTVIEYRKHVQELIPEIRKRGNIPLLVGGSGFYLHSLFFPPQLLEHISQEIPEIDIPTEQLWEQLYAIDPDRAMTIDRRDIYRIKRALAIWYATGKLPSTLIPHYNPIASAHVICLLRNNQDLNKRINDRVVAMFEQGWMQEVVQFIGTPWEIFIKEKKLIGYNEILHYLEQEGNIQEPSEYLVRIIQKRTQRYAKRQIKFWRMIERTLLEAIANNPDRKEQVSIEKVNLTTIDIHIYIKHLREIIEPLLP